MAIVETASVSEGVQPFAEKVATLWRGCLPCPKAKGSVSLSMHVGAYIDNGYETPGLEVGGCTH